jgi:hypothetical protein
MCFVLTDHETIVICPSGTFLIRYDHNNYKMQLERLRDMIRRKKMKSMADLLDYCQYRPGNYPNQMCGLELIPTRLERHV